MAELSSSLLINQESSPQTSPTSFLSRFSTRTRASFKVTEASASLSAGLHHRNFHRREKINATTGNHNNNTGCCCCTPTCVERLIHKGYWRGLYMFIITLNLLLAMIEPSSLRTMCVVGGHDSDCRTGDYPGEQNGILILEMLFLSFYGLDIWLRWFAGEDVTKDVWLRLRGFAMCLIFLNLTTCLVNRIVNPNTEGFKNFSRLLRPLLFIERLRNVRKIASSVVSTLPKVINILVLLGFWVLFFGVSGFTFFAGVVGPNDVLNPDTGVITTHGCDFLSGGIVYVENMNERLAKHNETFFACSTYSKIRPDGSPCTNYFDTIWTSMMHLFILLTTANYPDIMMPMYDCNQWASLFFILFITVGLYFLLSLILAVVYTHFAARNSVISTNMKKKKIKSLTHAFRLMYELTKSEIETKNEANNEANNQTNETKCIINEGDINEIRSENETKETKETQEPRRRKVTIIDDASGALSVTDETVAMYAPSGSISLQVWTNVVKEYRPTLPIEIIESLFAMHDRDATGYMTWEQFCAAVEHTRLKISHKKKRSTNNINSRNNSSSSNNRRSSIIQIKTKVNDCRRMMRIMLRHKYYDSFMDLLIIINTSFMLLRLSPGLLGKNSTLAIGNSMTVLLFIFVIEIIIKCYALSPQVFWSISHFNKIDFFCIGGGLISQIILWLTHKKIVTDGIVEKDNSGLSEIFLLVRMIRMLRILRMNEAFRVISATIVEIAPALLRYIGVLAGLFYAFAVIGMELFAGLLSRKCLNAKFESMQECELRVYRLEHSSYGLNNYWSNNFATLPNSLVTLYEQMVVNNWVIVMEGCVAGTGNEWPRLYFISFWVCCVVITMNVLIAFLIDAYQAHVSSIAKRVERWEKDRRRRLHSQTSVPDRLRSVSVRSVNSGGESVGEIERKRKMSMKEIVWQNRLQMAGDNLGYDLSRYSIKKEKGVSDFYQELFQADG